MSSAADESARTLGEGTAGDRDPLIRQAEQAAAARAQAEQRVHAARASDVRYVIGGLFLLYGAMLLVASAFTTAANLHKAQGVNINLWTGLAMFILGGLFVTWATLRPVSVDDVAEVPAGEGTYPESQQAEPAQPRHRR